MRTVLAIETSSAVFSGIAVVRDGEVLFEEQCHCDRSHNARLFGPLREALAVAEPDAVAIGTGPGSYVGVRIGISAAMGIAAVRQIPMLGLSSLLFLSGVSEGESEARAIMVIGDARRGQVWVALVRDGRLEEPPIPMGSAEARAKLESAEGTVVATPDPVMPLEGITGSVVAPSATLLGRRISLMGVSEFSEAIQVPVVPIYLAAPFVTGPEGSGE